MTVMKAKMAMIRRFLCFDEFWEGINKFLRLDDGFDFSPGLLERV